MEMTSVPHTRRIIAHTQQSPVAIYPVDAGEWKRVDQTLVSPCVDARRGPVPWRGLAHLLSRQQIHSADGHELGDVCTATIFPGGVCVCVCPMLPEEEASRGRPVVVY